MRRRSIAGLVLIVGALSGCGDGESKADPCSDRDGALGSSAFVFVQSPVSGERVASGFRVTGCSNTFEATTEGEPTYS